MRNGPLRWPLIECKCVTWAMCGLRDRDRDTGHHISCSQRRRTRERPRDSHGAGPYRSPAPRVAHAHAPSSASPLEAFVEAEAAARRAQSRVGGVNAALALDVCDCATRTVRGFRDFQRGHARGCPAITASAPSDGPDPWRERYPVWIAGREARGAGCGLDVCPEGAPETRRAWANGWRHADAERAQARTRRS